MAESRDILALDIATRTGFARGRVGEQPTFGSINFRTGRADTDNAIFGRALKWFADILKAEPKPDLLILEALLPPNARQRVTGKTSRAALERLSGLQGIVRGVAYLRAIPEIADATVADVRGHFLGERNCKRAEAKKLTMARCERLGWHVHDDNAADALALWSFSCSLIDPRLAINVVPLFNPRLVAV